MDFATRHLPIIVSENCHRAHLRYVNRGSSVPFYGIAQKTFWRSRQGNTEADVFQSDGVTATRHRAFGWRFQENVQDLIVWHAELVDDFGMVGPHQVFHRLTRRRKHLRF